MDEAKKTNRIRGANFAQQFLTGRKVIDIGAGGDLVCAWAEGFDIQDGDANRMTEYRAAGTYDVVHSSHCLEHMTTPTEALREWWALLKPGGHLILVVPDEDLYEQGIWPSIFNGDHKATFRLDKTQSWSPVSHEVRSLVTALPGAEIISAEVQDQGYRHVLRMHAGQPSRRMRRLARYYGLLRRIPGLGLYGVKCLQSLFFLWRVPADQTWGDAVAQIQIIARKTA